MSHPRRRVRSTLLTCSLALTACAPASSLASPTPPPPLPPSPTPPPPLPPSPTPTVAFPTLIPTPTVTPQASPTPSPDIVGGLGPLLFTAGFTAEEGWLLSSDADGAASLSRESLVIAVSRPNSSRFVLVPMPAAADFLLEATIRPDLCASEDEIGLFFRVSPQGDHYRTTLTCGGLARLTRVVSSRAAVLAGPTEAPSAIPGSPAENRLTILARGPVFTLVVNGVEVLQARDGLLPSGGFGFFVRSASQGQTTAALISLAVWALPSEPAATPPPASG